MACCALVYEGNETLAIANQSGHPSVVSFSQFKRYVETDILGYTAQTRRPPYRIVNDRKISKEPLRYSGLGQTPPWPKAARLRCDPNRRGRLLLRKHDRYVGKLQIDVRDDEIIVTLPATSYTVTYYKPARSPQLLGRNFPKKDDSRVPMTQAEFLTQAWKLANDKARELGWIV